MAQEFVREGFAALAVDLMHGNSASQGKTFARPGKSEGDA
tara:strand:+ start:253 stop:372 length:120 start_codon:yes stop_codon:yes gene_type:complete